MPYIEVTENDLRRLRELAGIFEIKDVVSRLIDDFLEDYTKPQISPQSGEIEVCSFEDPPSLIHAKFISGSFGEIASNASTWNGFFAQVLEIAYSRLGSFQALNRIVGQKVVQGEKTDEGYKYIPSFNISFQNVSAHYAAKFIWQIAKSLSVPVMIDFVWRAKEEALKPGESGRLSYIPG